MNAENQSKPASLSSRSTQDINCPSRKERLPASLSVSLLPPRLIANSVHNASSRPFSSNLLKVSLEASICTCRVPRLQPTLTTRLPIHVGTTTLLHLFKPILPSHTMRSSAEWNTFPLEVWLCILDHSSVGVHKAMSQLSSAFNEVTKTLSYVDPWR